MSYALLIQVGILVGVYAYHRWFEDKPAKPRPPDLNMPRIEEGSAVPLIFGRTRVRAPILAWTDNGKVVAAADISGGLAANNEYLWAADFFYILGIPFTDGTSLVHNVWAGELKLFWNEQLGGQTGDGEFENQILVESVIANGTGFIGGKLEFLNGKSTQRVIDATTYAPTTNIGRRIEITAPGGAGGLVPAFRGYLSAMLYGGTFSQWDPVTGPVESFWIGASPNPPSFSFEVSSYPNFGDFNTGPYSPVGVDANPVDVIYEILIGRLGKLGLDPSVIDMGSFIDAAATLKAENHGYSRAFEERMPASEMITEVLRQIDGILYQDRKTQLIVLKLIRADYNSSTIPKIHPDNCSDLDFADAGGWTSVHNKVRVIFSDRENSYQDGSVTSQSPANFFGQASEAAELVIRFPGCCTKELATTLCGRELAARSRPLMKCRATVDRRMLRANPGDVYSLSWPEANVVDRLMRIVGVTPGPSDSNSILLDMIEDYFFVYRFQPNPDTFPTFPDSAG